MGHRLVLLVASCLLLVLAVSGFLALHASLSWLPLMLASWATIAMIALVVALRAVIDALQSLRLWRAER